ncbi:hypothetical protein BD324DRAFT_637089 [Kockovaella imperatae]|uniref:Protein kinase regulator n=1 Tax=Kockovaella imperatae TaxID=4999 RepID=A0A1Y1UAU9_9TREE|nr:hypothetical protein BD324DRAFT_637089 [Kockovaella imperatae]ORX34205.1 hypothetical protein BD324DRAFT_637089 [Kockovaella imperatae]
MAAITSPTSASPRQLLLEWDEGAVHSYLVHIGLPQYEELIFEHGITGDVLAAMDHATLQDMGITSIGHRLNLLRAVWELKKEQGIDLGDDDWRPQDVESHTRKQLANVERLVDLIAEQQERLLYLERDHSRLLSTLEESGITIPVSSSADGDTLQGLRGPDKSTSSLKWREYAGSHSDGDEVEHSRLNRPGSQIFPSSLASSTASAPPPPLTADSNTFQDTFTPTTNSTFLADSPSNLLHNDRSVTPAKSIASQPLQPPPFQRQVSGSSILGASIASTSPSGLIPTSSKGSLGPASSSGSITTASTSTAGGERVSAPDSTDKSKAKDAARSAAKSFRVTLDDPCWRVLPAALRKYRINDDWKMYALFICFGNTERCLSYDEKPLMLFQKLKEGGQKPVFMLRHMRDIKSPIAVAQQKQAIKLGLPPNSTEDVLPKIRPASDTTSPTKATSLQPSRRPEEGQTPSGGAFPELPSPGLRETDATGPNAPRSAGGATGKKTLIDKDGNPQNVSYAVAIYPYIADRQDEFDVAVGATYVILSKAKGWYIVQRDPAGMGNITPDQSKSGWVPAGCLLELHSPISLLSAAPPDPAYPGLAPIPPPAIMSSSYPGVVLMDWEAKADDQVNLREGDRVRVYKKYCHWSYTIKQDTGERGWVPAWFIGKHSSSTNSESQPASAATPTGHAGPGQTPSTAATNGGGIGDGEDGRSDEDIK